jgi:hypothetical protein
LQLPVVPILPVAILEAIELLAIPLELPLELVTGGPERGLPL